ncbi:hypothetical protein LWI29_008886 [Acer saccharum]|uniref:Lipoxygenase domain-containing protein n=1 Tax=Acer saccharum TaxID=4024 RepID=A0AA39VUT6_ACESA|nr:hypothetical protein LWI29_008886 [Acer saccharum]
MLGNIVDNITGENNGTKEKVQGTVVLMKKNVLDFNDFPASLLDDVHELVGQRVSMQLTYLPSETPMPLRYYREQELVNLRGDGEGKLQESMTMLTTTIWVVPTRVKSTCVQFLEGLLSILILAEKEQVDHQQNQMPPLMSLTVYVPRNERFGHLKMSDFLAYALKVVVQFVKRALEAFDSTMNEFDSFEDVLKLFEGGFVLPGSSLLDDIGKNIPFEMLKEILRSDGEKLFEFPTPQVIKEDKYAWRTDEEFAREMLAGVNLVIFRRLEAIEKNKLIILDHHDPLMPQLRRINAYTFTSTYTSRTILFLKDDGTLKPLVIELSSPHPDGDQFGTVSKVYSSSEHGVEGSIWQLAKAYVGVNDSAVHHLISQWLHTHAVIEPFVIATNRPLSVLHPIHKLLFHTSRYNVHQCICSADPH